MGQSDFVGRADIVAQILGATASGSDTFFDIEGIPGIGKTRLLDQLAMLARPEDVIIRIDGDEFEGQGGRTSDVDAELRQFRRLLRGVLESLPGDGKITDVLKYLTDHSVSAQEARQADFTHDSDEIIELAIGTANHAVKTLADAQARFLVLVDDFHFLAGRPLGRWVMTWLTAVKGANVVLAHQEFAAAESSALPARAIRLHLGNLSREDVAAYLSSHTDIGPGDGGIIEHVWEFTGGYPVALVLAVDLISSDSPANAVRLIRQLAALEGGRAAQLTALVNRILDMIHDEVLRDALYKVCVTRHFDAPLVELLMRVDESRAQTLIDQLMHYSFVRRGADDHRFFAVSDFVRGIGEERLGPARTQATHAAAERYYQNLIDKEMEEDESTYERWLNYEKPEFQALERDWLYHLSRLTGGRRRAGRTGITKIFLDAFWWWGSYVEFPFCKQILNDWTEATSQDKEDVEWGTQLEIIHDNYPQGWKKTDKATVEQWATVRRALLHLMERGRFGESGHSADERHIRGILDCFLADCERHTDPRSPENDLRLKDAKNQFSALGDEWNVAWVEHYHASLALARDQDDLAISIVKDSARDHRDLDDHELTANQHRVCADAYWQKHQPGKALDAHARAILHAYRFQVRDLQDDYTREFQQEMIDRAVERLTAWHAGAGDGQRAELTAACVRVRAFFNPYWRETNASPLADVGREVLSALDQGRPADLAGMLFPALPTILGYSVTPYALTCRDITNKMRSELAEPPGSPL